MTGNLSRLFENVANELIVSGIVDVLGLFQAFDFGLLVWGELAEDNGVGVDKIIVAVRRGYRLLGGDVRRGKGRFLFPLTAGLLIHSELEDTIGISVFVRSILFHIVFCVCSADDNRTLLVERKTLPGGGKGFRIVLYASNCVIVLTKITIAQSRRKSS